MAQADSALEDHGLRSHSAAAEEWKELMALAQFPRSLDFNKKQGSAAAPGFLIDDDQ
jgi:hypothetical protein